MVLESTEPLKEKRTSISSEGTKVAGL